MASYPPDLGVRVREFTQYRDGDEVTISDLDRQVFLAIPADGLDILSSLAEGRTVGETVRRYQQQHAETPDIDGFLSVLAQEGFVGPPGEPAAAGREPARVRAYPEVFRRSWNLDWISPAVARRLCAPPVVLACVLLVGFGLALVVTDPTLLPGPGVMLFPGGHFAAFMWATVALAMAATALHELAHATVARAAGVPVRAGIGNLMYIMVAQTDISGLWMVPKRRRYLAFIAGSLIDAAGASLLVGLVWADRQGWLVLPPAVAVLIGALLFTYLLRISFQWFFYVKTDLYYVFAAAFNCKNLMSDTTRYLKNLVARVLFLRHRVVDQSGVPRSEMRGVRLYSLVYVVGRAIALGILFFYVLPVLWGYLYQVILLVAGREPRFGVVDFLTLAVLFVAVNGGGLYLWLHKLFAAYRRRPARVPA